MANLMRVGHRRCFIPAQTMAKLERMVDQVSGWFVPALIGVAILALVVWSLAGSQGAFTRRLRNRRLHRIRQRRGHGGNAGAAFLRGRFARRPEIGVGAASLGKGFRAPRHGFH